MSINVSSEVRAMQLRVGPYRSGKTTALIYELVEENRKARSQRQALNALLIVPSARYRKLIEGRLTEALIEQGEPGIFGLRVVTFHEVCRLLATAAGLWSRLVADKLRPELVSQVLEELHQRERLATLSAIARLPGTHVALMQLIDEFQRAGLSPADVIATLKNSAAADSRYMEIASVYDGYWKKLDALGITDEKRLAFTLRETLPERGDIKFDFVAVDGFDRMSRLQAQVIRAICDRARTARVLFDYVPGDDVPEDYQWKTESYLELVEELGDHFQEAQVAGAEHRRSGTTFSTLDRFMEMEEIARRCKQLIHSQATTPDRILVVARDLKPYRAAVEVAFSKAGVDSVFIDETIELADLPVIHYVRSLLNLWMQKLSREAVIDALRSPFCNLESLGLRQMEVADLDRESWNASVYLGTADWNKCLDNVSEQIKIGCQQLFQAVRPPDGRQQWSTFVSWTEDVLDRLLLTPERGTCADDFDSRKALVELRRALALLVQKESLLGKPPVEYDEFLRAFTELLESANYRRASRGHSSVTICGAELAPNKMYDYVFIAGMAESEFPRGSSPSGFNSSEELNRWCSFGVNISNPRLHPGFEAALFKSLCDRARKEVILSCPRFGMDGDEVIPSLLLTGGDDSSATFVEPFGNSLQQPASDWEAISAIWWHSPDCSWDTGGLPASLQSTAESISSRVTCHRQRTLSPDRGVYAGYLKDQFAAGVLSKVVPKDFSVTAFNDYGQCPFRYWARRVLKVKPREPRELRMDPMLLGDAYHAAMEKFYSSLKAAGLQLAACDPDVIYDHAERAIARAIEVIENDQRFYRDDFWEYEKLEISFRLRRFIAEELLRSRKDKEGFEPDMFEVKFGGTEEGVAPPLVLNTIEGEISIRGTVDRIDLATGNHVRVVDYKAGSSAISLKEAYSGRNLQLPVYAIAVERSLMPGSKVVSGRYLGISSGKAIGNIDFEKNADLLEQTQAMITAYAGGIAGGDFSLRPSSHAVCDRCDYTKICRISERLFAGDREEDNDEHSD